MDSEEDLVERLIVRLPIEEAEECLCQLEENLITVDYLRSAEQEDKEKELGFTARQCHAVLLNDTHWRAKYELEPTSVPDASSETSKAERESSGSAMVETVNGEQINATKKNKCNQKKELNIRVPLPPLNISQ